MIPAPKMSVTWDSRVPESQTPTLLGVRGRRHPSTGSRRQWVWPRFGVLLKRDALYGGHATALQAQRMYHETIEPQDRPFFSPPLATGPMPHDCSCEPECSQQWMLEPYYPAAIPAGPEHFPVARRLYEKYGISDWHEPGHPHPQFFVVDGQVVIHDYQLEKGVTA